MITSPDDDDEAMADAKFDDDEADPTETMANAMDRMIPPGLAFARLVPPPPRRRSSSLGTVIAGGGDEGRASGPLDVSRFDDDDDDNDDDDD